MNGGIIKSINQRVFLFVVLFVFGILNVSPAQAAAITSASDTLSTVTAGTVANHTIQFTTPTGVSEGQNITVTFPAGFTLTSIVENDVDITDDGVDLTTAADCTGSEQASAAVSGQVLTITICAGDGGAIGTSSVIAIEIGTNATSSGTGANQITNHATPATYTISIGGSMSDSGSLAISLISDDSVNLTATVNATITFTISDTTIGFGTLSASAPQWATGDTSGSGTDVVAHNMTVATNATAGYVVTFKGSTLTSPGSDTISVAAVTDDADGTAGSEQFGFSIATNGDASITSGYAYAGTPDWKFVDNTTTSIISETGPTATETFSMHYLTNIAATTEAGSYSTNITYIATGTF